MRLARARARGLDDVGIDRTLGQKLDTSELVSFFVKHFHERAPDDLALLLRIRDTRQRRQKALFSVDPNDTHTQMLSESAHHLVAFTQAQQTMIDEDTHQLVTDRT